jgi:transposase
VAIWAELLAGFARPSAWCGGRRDCRAAATKFEVSIAHIYKALMRRRLTGDAGIKPNRGHNPRKRNRPAGAALLRR